MALTRVVVPDSEDVFGKQRVVSQDITLDTSYPSGGYAISPASLGWSEIKGVTVIGGNSTAGGYKAHWDTTNKKLMVFSAGGFTPEGEFTGTAAAQVFTGTPLAAHTHTLFLNDAEVADAAGTRVNAGTNLLGANTGSDISVAGVADTTGHGGVVQITAGTPAGTNASSAVTGTFTGTAVAAGALSEVAAATNLSTVRFRVEFRGI